MISIYLHGKHSNRTPLAYEAYRELSKHKFKYVDSHKNADIVLTGFSADFKNNHSSLVNIKNDNHNAVFVVLSEEPLWDTVWNKEILPLKQNIEVKIDGKISSITYHFLNHSNTDIFDFDKVPYFITTNDHYWARYNTLFANTLKSSTSDLLATWKAAKYDFAFMGAKRTKDNLIVSFNEGRTLGLSVYRTRIAERLNTQKSLIEGEGWHEESIKRQSLPDWHLEKLSKFYRNCKIISAIENTHQRNYISEKIFDAFACQGVPLYFAQSDHLINKIINPNSYINLKTLDIESSIAKIKDFKVDANYAKEYKEATSSLFETFNSFKDYQHTRLQILQKIQTQFERILNANHP